MFDVAYIILWTKSSILIQAYRWMSVFWRDCMMDACVRNEKLNKRKYYMTEAYQHADPSVGFSFHSSFALNIWFCHLFHFVLALVFLYNSFLFFSSPPFCTVCVWACACVLDPFPLGNMISRSTKHKEWRKKIFHIETNSLTNHWGTLHATK